MRGVGEVRLELRARLDVVIGPIKRDGSEVVTKQAVARASTIKKRSPFQHRKWVS